MRLGRIALAVVFLAGGSMAQATVISSVPAPVSPSVAALPAEAMPVDEGAGAGGTADLTNVQASGAAMAVTPVASTPEPASFFFLGTGLIGLALRMRRSRRRERALHQAARTAARGALAEQSV